MANKLLLLGSNVGTLDMISYAKSIGTYTIVADNLPIERSIGKQYSDSNVLISTGDVEHLKQYIVNEGVKGVFAGVSEFNLLKAMQICNDLHLPFYCTVEQWNRIEDKEQFRNFCNFFDVPTPWTFFSGADMSEKEMRQISYPVVVKPVDSSSSKGVSICRNEKRLIDAIELAKKCSDKGNFIIEEFFEGEEFTAHYTIVNGRASLSCMDNRVPVAVHKGDVTTIPIARIYPSIYIDEYISQVNDKMICLCESLGMQCGVLFVQGLYNKINNKFAIFEAGLRCAGEAPYRFLAKTNGINFMNNFVDYALHGEVSSYDSNKEDPYLKGKHACVLSFVSKGGEVGDIINYDIVEKEVKTIIDKECRYQIGDLTPSGDTLRQIMLRFVLVCDSKEQMVADIEKINDLVQVYDKEGNNLCYKFNVREYMENE